MPIVRSLLLPSALAVLVALPAAAPAQARARAGRDTVPVHLLPPAGKCRIWMTGVPAAQQPAPTDCATALRQRPANGVVLYGPAPRDGNPDRFEPAGGRGAEHGTTERGTTGRERSEPRTARDVREVPVPRLAPSRPSSDRTVPERTRAARPSPERAAPERPSSAERAGPRAPAEPRKPPAETKKPE